MTDNDIINPCYLCKHPNEMPNRNKSFKCNNRECEWLKCWMKYETLREENNLQKTEIERLKSLANHHRAVINELNKGIVEAKSEAIKEFAKRVQGMVTIRGRQKDYFDDLLKEMTESVNYGSSKMEVSE